MGATVQLLSDVGSGVPDLLVGYNGINYLIEVKNEKTSYGKSGLNNLQESWHDKWKGQVMTVSTIDEALTIFKTNNNLQVMANKAILVGNVGGDPELRETASGTPVVNLSLATTERWKDSDGNRQERTEWHRLFMFGKRAEVIAEYVKKGDRLFVEGSIRYNSYEQDGETKYSTSIEITNFEFLSNNNDGQTNDNSPAKSVKSAAGGKTSGGAKGRGRAAKSQADSEGDDLPF